MRHLLEFYVSHPWIGLIGTVASVVSLFLGIYFFLASRQYPDLTFTLEPARIRLVTPGYTSALKVMADGEEVTSEVSAAQVALWNRGTQPIRDTDVLEPIVLAMDPSVPILEARIVRVAREVSTLRLDASQRRAGLVPVAFRILEPADGAVIQLIFAGPPDAKVTVRGTMVGQRSVSVAWRPSASIPEQRPTRGSFVRIALFCSALSGVFLVLLVRVGVLSTYPTRTRIGGALFLASQVAYFGYVTFDAVRNAVRMARPPF